MQEALLFSIILRKLLLASLCPQEDSLHNMLGYLFKCSEKCANLLVGNESFRKYEMVHCSQSSRLNRQRFNILHSIHSRLVAHQHSMSVLLGDFSFSIHFLTFRESAFFSLVLALRQYTLFRKSTIFGRSFEVLLLP